MPNWKRRQLITDLIRGEPIASQRELVDALERHGERVTQATISRELAALGVVKGPGGYALPEEVASASGNGRSLGGVLRDLALRCEAADSMVIVHTPPGHAMPVAAAIDRAPPAGCVGTIAGDDTIFIATPGREDAQQLAVQITALIGGEGATP